jgi:transposase
MKKDALRLYLEGLGFRSIGRFLGVSNVSVLNWIRSFGEEVATLHQDSKEIEVVELDEMHSYVGSKKTIVGSGLLLIDMEKDSSTSLLATANSLSCSESCVAVL